LFDLGVQKRVYGPIPRAADASVAGRVVDEDHGQLTPRFASQRRNVFHELVGLNQRSRAGHPDSCQRADDEHVDLLGLDLPGYLCASLLGAEAELAPRVF
jgi:hypothetical protein